MVETINVEEFIQSALEYNKENNIEFKLQKGETCPVHVIASKQNKPCMELVSGIADCRKFGMPMCSRCKNHNVSQLSRVTGYISTISDKYGNGWNNGKKEELKNRHRYNLH